MKRLIVGFALLAGCGWREEGTSVELVVTVAVPLTGYTTSTLALEAVELVPCPATTWWKAWSPIGVAHAHGGEATQTSPWTTAPSALLHLDVDAPQHLATLHPPPGTLCALLLTFAPSTADARAQGTTLLLEPEPGSDRARQLSTRTAQRRIELPQPLALDAQHLRATVALQLTADVRDSGDESLASVAASLRTP